MSQVSNVLDSENGLPPDTRDYTEDETQPLLNSNRSHPDPGLDVIDLSGIDNPHNPMNMPAWRKWSCTCVLGAMTFAATFSSSVFNAAIPVTAREFNVSPETMSLATSLFVFGFAAGPVLMGPASELLGRKIPFFLGYLAFIRCWCFGFSAEWLLRHHQQLLEDTLQTSWLPSTVALLLPFSLP